MSISSMALASAVRDLALPETVVRAVVFDYLDFLAARKPQERERLETRLLSEDKLYDLFYFEAQASMLGATLILTMEASVPVAAMLLEVYGKQTDPDLLAMRRELVSRALAQAKSAVALTGVPAAAIESRKAEFCA